MHLQYIPENWSQYVLYDLSGNIKYTTSVIIIIYVYFLVQW